MEPIKKIKLMGQDGFTLAEILVAAALIGVLALALSSQLKLVGSSRMESSERIIMNKLTDRLAVELSKQETCTANFGGKAIVRTLVANEALVDGTGTAMIKVGESYSERDLTSNTQAKGTQSKSIQVTEIKTQVGSHADEMSVVVSFKKKSLLGAFIPSHQVTLSLSIIKDTAVTVKYCYNDITNSIASAIRLSCQGNNSYYDNSAANLPYGVCKHFTDVTSCGANQYLQRIEVPDASATGTKTLKFTCASLPSCTDPLKVVAGFNADGTVACEYPFPNCGAGQLMVRSTSSGRYICLPTDVNCVPTSAITAFNENGTVTCTGFYPPGTCPAGQKATAYSPSGGLSCSPAYRQKHCAAGEFISGTDASGTGVCSKYLTPNFSCGAGSGAIGVAANGDLICQPLAKSWCNGTPSSHTDAQCAAIGGSIVNPGTNQVCKVPAASCPGGWTACPTWAQTAAGPGCTDTNSNCPSLVQTRNVFGQAWSTPITPASVQCHYWYDIPGDGNAFGACGDGGVSATSTEPQTYTGCY
ncbi:MAG: type II secretion system protein [Bacteriovorax sp.]|jgi:prepilin-type N-terminal cleavage/methylation domain-containing protein